MKGGCRFGKCKQQDAWRRSLGIHWTRLINHPWGRWGQWQKLSKESSGIKWPHELLIDEWHVVPQDSSFVVALFKS